MLKLKQGAEPVPGYVLEHLLGSGGWGEVWKARRPDGTRLALKFLPCDSQAAAAQEVRALQAVRQLKHPNLIHFEHVWCCEGCVVVGMELAEGSLLDLLEISIEEFHSPLTPDKACFFLSQAALALDFLNKRQHLIDGQRVAFRHCDVKPSNILLKAGQVKVADFSLAVRTSSRLWYHKQSGTPMYAAPETFHGCLSENTDQFGLAVTYCQVRGGRFPFESIKAPVLAWPEPDLSMLSPDERPTVARALATVPLDRWPSCTEMMERLTAAVAKRRTVVAR
jgi:serine/threonine protein kinase